jgi:hypothetical protein
MIRDVNNMALLNNDIDALNKYKELKKNRNQFKELSDDLKKLKCIVESIQKRLESIEERI